MIFLGDDDAVQIGRSITNPGECNFEDFNRSPVEKHLNKFVGRAK